MGELPAIWEQAVGGGEGLISAKVTGGSHQLVKSTSRPLCGKLPPNRPSSEWRVIQALCVWNASSVTLD